jgi:hypothetical protein
VAAPKASPQNLRSNEKGLRFAKTFGTEGSLEEASKHKNYFFFLAAFLAFFFVAIGFFSSELDFVAEALHLCRNTLCSDAI